jgi:small subunit ribosomal protein S4
MAKLTESKCKRCRRAGEKLFLKGERCFTPKCAMVRRPYAPGAKGAKKRSRGGLSDYGRQLREKQRIKVTYGVLEKQLKIYFRRAQAQKGDPRENLMKIFEMRLDNVIFRLGLAKSRPAARQLVNHEHILVNRKKVSIPSYQIRKNDVISLKERTKLSRLTEDLTVKFKKYEPPKWLALDREKTEGKVLQAPDTDDLGDVSPIGLIVAFYSR